MSETNTRKSRGLLWHDFFLIAVSVAVAWWLTHNGVIQIILESTKHFLVVGGLISGLFFTSVFTIAPAVIIIGELAREGSNIFLIALLGGVGAVFGDMIIFRFVRNRLIDDLMDAIGERKIRHMLGVLKFSPIRWLFILAGAAIIASPFPDELGLALMGVAKMPTRIFIPLVFILNSIGILTVAAIARGI